MSPQMLTGGKIATLGLWIILFLNLISPMGGLAGLLKIGLVLLILTHAFEAMVFYNKHKDAGDQAKADAGQVFIFGFFHTLSVKDKYAGIERSEPIG